jgi:hypothetical protein
LTGKEIVAVTPQQADIAAGAPRAPQGPCTLIRTLPAKFRKLLVSLGSAPELLTTSGDWRHRVAKWDVVSQSDQRSPAEVVARDPIRIAGTSIVKPNKPLFMTTISEQFPCFPIPWTKNRLKFRLMGWEVGTASRRHRPLRQLQARAVAPYRASTRPTLRLPAAAARRRDAVTAIQPNGRRR